LKRPSKLDDGSHLRERVIVALVDSGVAVRRLSGETYEITNSDGDPFVYALPPVVGYRLIQVFITEFGLDFLKLRAPTTGLN
jgi:hypothetical protein